MTSVVEWSKAVLDPGSLPRPCNLIFSFFLIFWDFFLVLSLSGVCALFSLVCFSEFDLQGVPCAGTYFSAILDFYDRSLFPFVCVYVLTSLTSLSVLLALL